MFCFVTLGPVLVLASIFSSLTLVLNNSFTLCNVILVVTCFSAVAMFLSWNLCFQNVSVLHNRWYLGCFTTFLIRLTLIYFFNRQFYFIIYIYIILVNISPIKNFFIFRKHIIRTLLVKKRLHCCIAVLWTYFIFLLCYLVLLYSVISN